MPHGSPKPEPTSDRKKVLFFTHMSRFLFFHTTLNESARRSRSDLPVNRLVSFSSTRQRMQGAHSTTFARCESSSVSPSEA